MSLRDEHQVRATYDTVADDYADYFADHTPEPPVDLAMVDLFVGELGERPKVLDAGCGAGRMLPLLAGLGATVTGVDLSVGMIRRAQEDHPSFSTQVASLGSLPFDDGEFDGVFSWFSTIHSEDEQLGAYFAEFRRVLRPDGLALVAGQSGAGIVDVSDAYRLRGHDVELFRKRRGVADLARLLTDARLTPVASFERSPGLGDRDGISLVIARRQTA